MQNMNAMRPMRPDGRPNGGMQRQGGGGRMQPQGRRTARGRPGMGGPGGNRPGGILGKLLNMQDPVGSLNKLVGIFKLLG